MSNLLQDIEPNTAKQSQIHIKMMMNILTLDSNLIKVNQAQMIPFHEQYSLYFASFISPVLTYIPKSKKNVLHDKTWLS